MHDTITIEPVAASHMLVYSTCSISLEGFIHFHGGSGVGSYTTLIKEYFPNATVLESLGIAGVSIRDASSKQTVENWLKKLGVDKQSTAITNVRTRSVDNGVSYTLNGMPSNNQRGLYIKNGKKYVSK